MKIYFPDLINAVRSFGGFYFLNIVLYRAQKSAPSADPEVNTNPLTPEHRSSRKSSNGRPSRCRTTRAHGNRKEERDAGIFLERRAKSPHSITKKRIAKPLLLTIPGLCVKCAFKVKCDINMRIKVIRELLFMN